jgi:signal transduction histidine kinase/DNA-binding response OmpR family regulator
MRSFPPLRPLPSVLPHRPEDEPGFRQLIDRLCQSGMFYASLFGIALTVVYVLTHVVLVGKNPSWTYVGANPTDTVVLWDKLIIAALCAGALVLSRATVSIRLGRIVTAILVLAISGAMLFDDILHQNVNFSAAFFALVLLAAVNTIPYTAFQTFLLGMGTVAVLYFGKVLIPPLLGVASIEPQVSQVIYLIMVVALVTGLSSLIYRYRYQQYAAQRSADSLNRSLEQRTRQLEEEQRKTAEQTKRLIEMEDLKSRFFSNISHEFRTPLTLISGPLEEAIEGRYGDLPAELQKRHRVMLHSAKRLLRLVNQLLDLSKLEAGRMELQPRPGDLVAFLHQLVPAFLPMAERKSITLRFQSTIESLPTSFDPDKIEKIFSNLVANALKFTPVGGKVWIALTDPPRDQTTLDQRWAEVSVKDTGPGIPSDSLDRIFDRFHRLSDTEEGTGLGLALVRELAELHGGTIAVDSEPGFGSTFIVRIPLADVSHDEMRHPSLVPPNVDLEAIVLEPAAGDGGLPEEEDALPLVLIVDDNPDLRAYLRECLTPEFRTAEATDGAAALGLLRTLRPDVVLSDVMMPVMDGLAFCRALKSDPQLQPIPVILLTARADAADAVEGLGVGADDYVSKPFHAHELKARLRNLIASRQIMRHQFSREIVVQPAGVVVQAEEEVLVQRILSLVETHLGESTFNVDTLAAELGMSRRQFERKLQALLGESPAELIRRMRLARAEQLLRARAGTVAEIGYSVGFKSPSHFSAAFRAAYGTSPTDYIGTSPTDYIGAPSR